MSGSFKQVGETNERMYGDRKLLVCGYSANEIAALEEKLFIDIFNNLDVVYPDRSIVDMSLKEVFGKEHGFGKNTDSDISRAIIMSGFTEKELHTLMNNYKSTNIERPLWATLTPTSEEWKVEELLTELDRERKAFYEMNKNRQ